MKIPRRISILIGIMLVLMGCDQSAIFYNISNETPFKEPIIEGVPSKMVEFDGKVYIANGLLWAYDGAQWTKVNAPARVRDIAAADGKLYAMGISNDPSNNTLHVSSDGLNWTLISNSTQYTMLQTIVGAGDLLIVGASQDSQDEQALLAVSGTNLTELKTGLSSGGYLIGALRLPSEGPYVVATSGEGIYSGTSIEALTTATAIEGSKKDDYHLTGMLCLPSGTIVAVGSDNNQQGFILSGTTASFTTVLSESSNKFTGALGIQKIPSGEYLLLIGRNLSVNANGYLELELSDTDMPGTIDLREPGENAPTGIDDYDTYASSLRKRVINHLYIYPAETGILFASTQQNGLYSYRNNAWNAED